MTSLVRTTTRWASIVLLAAALAACGTSGSKSASTTAAKSTTTGAKPATTAGTDSTSTPDTSSTTGSTGTTPTTTPSTANTTPSTVVATGGGEFCKSIADSYNTGIAQPSASAATPEGLRKLVEESQKKNNAALGSAPGEIKADLGVLYGASNKLIAALAKVNYDFKKLPPSAAAPLSSPEVQAASTRVLAFVKKDCGISLGGASSGGATSPPTTTP